MSESGHRAGDHARAAGTAPGQLATRGEHAVRLGASPAVQALQAKGRALNARVPPARGVVQRAIGYEAEVGALSASPVKDKPKPDLAKGMVLWRGSGWDVSIDELNQGFDIEFRTSPIDDLVSSGRSTAKAKLAAMAGEWSKMPKAGKTKVASEINSSAPDNVQIHSGGSEFAQLQASAGLSLEALHAIRTGATKTKFDKLQPDNEEGGERKYVIGNAGVADKEITDAVNSHKGKIRAALNLKNDNIDYLCTVIGMIVNIPFAAHAGGLPYPKSAAGGLLARTNFPTILKQLPPGQLTAIKKNAGAWRDVLVEITQALAGKKLDQHSPVFPATSHSEGKAKGSDTLEQNLKLGSWYEGLAGGHDEGTEQGYVEKHKDAEGGKLLESLGSYGERMDVGSYSVNPVALTEIVVGISSLIGGYISGLTTLRGGTAGAVGTALTLHGASTITRPNRNRPIFEFRALGLIDREGLVNAGLALWDYVELAHDRQTGGSNALSSFGNAWNQLGSKN